MSRIAEIPFKVSNMIPFGPLDNSIEYPIMFDNWSIHDLELILLTGLNNV